MHRNFINKPQNSQILFFNKAERQKIQEKFAMTSNTQVEFGYTATINNISKNIKNLILYLGYYLNNCQLL